MDNMKLKNKSLNTYRKVLKTMFYIASGKNRNSAIIKQIMGQNHLRSKNY